MKAVTEMRPMTGPELRVAIGQIGITQEGLADVLQIGHRTIRNYLAGTTSIPAPVAMLVRILNSRRNWGELLTIGYGG